jgi:enoyl-CoA hydratase/carnithine racemase
MTNDTSDAGDRILLRKEGPIARIVLNNPARHNAISIAMWNAAEAMLDELADDGAIRVVVLSGEGGKAFSAGADISEFERRHADPASIALHSATTERVNQKLAALPKPTIASIEGFCMGGAMVLALCCDLRIASAPSRFAIPPAKLGNGYSHDDIARVVDAVGLANTREILFTGRQFTASEAHAMGVVNRVVPPDELRPTVESYCDTIARNAPLTVQAIKRITVELAKDKAERDIALCERLFDACYASADYQEGRRAFMEKRRPNFTGR